MAKYRCKVIKMVLKKTIGKYLSMKACNAATSQPVYKEIQLTGFCVMQTFTKGYF